MAGRQSASRGSYAALALLCATTFAAFLYKTVLDTGGVSYTLSLGGTMAEAGIQASAFFAASIAARFVAGPLADMHGNRRAMLAGLMLLIAGAVVLAWALEFWQVVAARCIQACGLAAFYPAAAATVGALAPRGRSGTWLGLFRLAVALPMLFGPALFLELAREAGWSACFAILGIGSIAAFALELLCGVGRDDLGASGGRRGVAARVGDSDAGGRGDGSRAAGIAAGARMIIGAFAENRRELPASLTLAFAAAIPFALASNFAVVMAQQAGEANMQLYFALLGAGGIAGAPLSGLLSDRIGAGRLAVLSLAAEIAGILALIAMPACPPLLYVAGACIGLGKSGTAVGILAYMSQEIDSAHRTLSLALQQSAGDLGSAALSLAAGAAFSASGAAPAPLAGTAALCACALLAAALLGGKR